MIRGLRRAYIYVIILILNDYIFLRLFGQQLLSLKDRKNETERTKICEDFLTTGPLNYRTVTCVKDEQCQLDQSKVVREAALRRLHAYSWDVKTGLLVHEDGPWRACVGFSKSTFDRPECPPEWCS